MELENLFRNKMQELNCYAKDLGFNNFKQWGLNQLDLKKISTLDSSKIALYHDMRNVISHGFAGKIIIDQEDIKFLDQYISIMKKTLGIQEEPEKTKLVDLKKQTIKSDNVANKKEIIAYIKWLKNNAVNKGLKELTIRAGDLEKALGLKQRIVSVCSAMYACMSNKDEVLQAPKSGYSTTVIVKYYL